MASAHPRLNWLISTAPRERLVLLLGSAWGIGAAWWIVQEHWIALALWLIVPPLFLIVARAPFAAVLVWILFAPIFARAYADDTRWLNWLFARLLFPAALALTLWSFRPAIAHHRFGVISNPSIPSFFGACLRDKLCDKSRPAKPRFRRWLHRTPLEMTNALFILAVALLILLTNPNPIRHLISFYDLLIVPICCYWVVRLNPPSAREWRWLAIVCAFAFTFQIIVGGMAWIVPALLPYEWLELYGERTIGTLGRPAVFTGALTLFAFIIFYTASASDKRWVRGSGILTLALALLAMLWSFSRGSWLATVAVAGGFIWLYARTIRKAMVIGAALILLITGGLVIQNADWAWARLTDFKRAEERLIDQVTSLRMIAEHPVLGWGYLQHNASRSEYVTPLFSGHVVPELVSHNTYLTLIADLGIPLFILYVTPALWWLWRTWQTRNMLAHARFRLLILLWLALLHLFIVSNFSDVTSWHPVGTILWWLTLGLVANVVTAGGRDDPAPTQRVGDNAAM